MNRTIVEKARCFKLNAKLANNLWTEVLNIVYFLINKLPARISSEEISKINAKSK